MSLVVCTCLQVYVGVRWCYEVSVGVGCMWVYVGVCRYLSESAGICERLLVSVSVCMYL